MSHRHFAFSTSLLVMLAAVNAGTSGTDTKTLTIKGSNADSGDTIEILVMPRLALS